MLLYARLAAVAGQKHQPQGLVRFLILSGVAATRAGCPRLADRCQALIAAITPHHLVTRYASFAAALRDDDFQPFLRQLQRFCPVELAEHLLAQAGETPPDHSPSQSLEDVALALLADMPPRQQLSQEPTEQR